MGGDLGSKKEQNSDSSIRDFRSTAGGDSQGGENNTNTIIEGGDLVAEQALKTAGDALGVSEKTVLDVVKAQTDAQLQNRAFDTDVLKTFVTANQNLTDSTVSRLSTLAETKITDGANLNQKTTIIALSIGGAVLLLSLLGKKS